MLKKIVKQKMPYIVDGILPVQEFLMSDQPNVDVLHVYMKMDTLDRL